MKNKIINIFTTVIVIIFLIYILYKLFNKLKEAFQISGNSCGVGGIPMQMRDSSGRIFTNCLKLYYAVNNNCNVGDYKGAIYNPTKKFIKTNQNRAICIGTKSQTTGINLYLKASSNIGTCDANQGEVKMDMMNNSNRIDGSICFRLQYTTNDICIITPSAREAGFRTVINSLTSEVKDIGKKSICITNRRI